MTTIHHFYGAYIYDEPIRLHAAIIAIPVIIVLLATYFGQDRAQDTASTKRLRAIFIGVTFLFPIAAIGIYEGGYNHVIKDVLFFSGVPTQFLDRMYPSVYQLPDDFLFEFTGVAQFFTGVACTIFLFRSFRRKIVRT
jgi:hypothetical protein